jgi:sugar (pentulose or hexulose) kinase
MHGLLGLDIGSSAVKVGLFDEAGTALATASYAYSTAEPRPGFKEQNPEDWWTGVKKGIHQVLGEVEDVTVVAVGATGCISSLTFVDGEGNVLRPSIAFQDQRAVEEVAEIQQEFSRGELAELLGIDLPPAPNWPLPRLLRMRKHEPEVLERTRYLLQAKDYVNLQLTGEFASDSSSNRGLVDLSTNCSAKAIFAKLNLPDLVPLLFRPEEMIGRVTRKAAGETGLTAGLPVVAGWNDLNACVLGSGIVEDGQAFDVTGTSEHIGVVTSNDYATERLMCAPYLPGKKLLYGVTSSGGGSLPWFSRFAGKSIDELLASTAVTSSELIFLPYLEGERAPIWDPLASGVLVGLRSSHGQGDVARAVLEGVAFSLRQIIELVETHAAFRPQTLIASGGGSTAAVWNQIKADVLDKEVVTLRNPHAGILGAAILASVAGGFYADIESAAVRMTRTAQHFRPIETNRRHMDEMFALYNEVYPALRGTMGRLRRENLFTSNEENR